ncbi:MAG: type II toxin-antitoxin system HicB family antitoxin [Chromatiaceae bacterium]|nr:type II toxin-antitoxin system HicB family antitoxin [Chromatiaceae bacterium]MBP6806970.1 type II toxin-antitoxin system HicB family antitoxin [Chromatiaceae bacterium]MBP8282620.1 type II toxin-antitoxin system HicB family antitoxin [Chromatiaceae bacterium]MBP8288332.1 type II toxin-antitoxin system HicB family antitoxin [Chromatiaceae bacterium]MBP9603080.1 type II toxin-antitoxin system HicB family antitoxin [Chromatiaceae bacterium]
MSHYVALLHREADTYGVSIPNFPGCISAGKSLDDALRQAAEALAFHVAGMEEDGLPIPQPRSLEAIRAAGEDWIVWEGAIVALVPLLPPPEIYQHVNLKLPKRLLAEIDAVSRNRSGFLEQAARESLRRVA